MDLKNLITDLSHSDWHKREQACKELGKLGSDTPVELLNNLLDDKHPLVQQAACDALGDIGDKRAVFPMLERLDTYKRLRRSICRALGKIGDLRAVDAMLIYINDESPSVCFAAFKSLGQLGDKRTLDPLIEKLEHKDWHVREAICQALANLGDKRAVDPIIGVLDDYTRVRWAACKALGQLGDIKAVLPMIKLLDDDEEGIRSEAITALYEIGDPSAIVPILAKLCDPSQSVYETAITVLQNLDKDSIISSITGDPENGINPDFKGLDHLYQALESSNKKINKFAVHLIRAVTENLNLGMEKYTCSSCNSSFECRMHQLGWKTKVKILVCRKCGKAEGLQVDAD